MTYAVSFKEKKYIKPNKKDKALYKFFFSLLLAQLSLKIKLYICMQLKMMRGITFKLHNSWASLQINDSEIKDPESWGKNLPTWSLMVAVVTDTELHELSTATLLEMSFPCAKLTSHSSSSPHFYSPANWWIHVRSLRQWHSYCKARLLMSYKRPFVTPSNDSWERRLFSTTTTTANVGETGLMQMDRALSCKATLLTSNEILDWALTLRSTVRIHMVGKAKVKLKKRR